MTTFDRRLTAQRAFVAAMLLAALSGCALLGGGKPAALYSFGTAPASAAASIPAARPVTILYPGATFARQSGGTRILTENGNQAAYVAEAKWVAPAAELFDAAAIRRLESAVPSLQVIRAGARAQPEYLLAIDVQRFAAVYSGVPDAPPVAVIQARAKLVRVADRAIVGDWPIEASMPAAENRVTSIVAALDGSTAAVVSRVADLTREATSERLGG